MMVRRLSVIRPTSLFYRNGPRRPGVTLAETLVALGLLGLAIGLLAGLATEYQGIIRFTEGRKASMVAVSSLQTIARSVAQATSVLSPDEGATDEPQLSLGMLDYGSPERMVDDSVYDWVTDTSSGGWSPRRATDILTVNFRLTKDRLIRETIDDSGKTSTDDMAQDLAGFSVSRPSANTVRISASVQESRRIETFTVYGVVWAR